MRADQLADFFFTGSVVTPATVLLGGGPVGLAVIAFGVLLTVAMACAVLDPDAPFQRAQPGRDRAHTRPPRHRRF